MNIHIHIAKVEIINDDNAKLDEILTKLNLIIKKQEQIMTKQEFADAVNAVSDQLQKALNEIIAAVQASGNSTPEMDAALTRLQTAAQALDDLNPDAPAPTPAP